MRDDRGRRFARPAGVALVVLGALWWLVVGDLVAHGVSFFSGLAVQWVGLGLYWWGVGGGREQAPAGRDAWVSMGTVLGVALVVRLLAAGLGPSLSDDIHRYLWDGRVLSAGSNPYALAPEDERLAPLRDEVWRATAHREVPTVYPPAALGLFSIAASSPAPEATWRALLIALDLWGCWLLWRLARLLPVDPARTVLWSWNPLVTLEGAGMGHVDLAGVPFVIAAVLLLARGRRPAVAGLAAAGGVLIKLVPVVALLPWWRGLPRRAGAAFAVAAGGLLAVAALPVALSVGGVPPGLVRYGVSWEFNGPLFEPLWRLLDAAAAPAVAKSGLDALKARTGWEATLDPLYHYAYPQLLAKLVLAALLVALVALAVRRARRAGPVATSHQVLAGALLCSATLYPWYATWPLPFAALLLRGPWILLSATVLLGYLPAQTGLALFPWVWAAVWAPPLCWWLGSRALASRRDGGARA